MVSFETPVNILEIVNLSKHVISARIVLDSIDLFVQYYEIILDQLMLTIFCKPIPASQAFNTPST